MGGTTSTFMEETLAIFCNKYSPGTALTATDRFSSQEIKRIIDSHVGETVELKELHKLMVQMGYQYELLDEEFVWLVIKE